MCSCGVNVTLFLSEINKMFDLFYTKIEKSKKIDLPMKVGIYLFDTLQLKTPAVQIFEFHLVVFLKELLRNLCVEIDLGVFSDEALGLFLHHCKNVNMPQVSFNSSDSPTQNRREKSQQQQALTATGSDHFHVRWICLGFPPICFTVCVCYEKLICH